ncbi:TIGR03016 family PEP-CTERM system-associated outer membrane protein [Falsiroseomonas oryzae]|uniref:TIGR03016 family PEP-CTERM system-associated outer membrane protein n=1 Tax=Falsiroseomonas oryzae TaxID=2766473 RepID=UPI0022EA19D5|nr:TIGR03016 family PEP-CTERM system-associated outer membrane protein [Roseomonas sp. MO-31]
MAERRPRGRRAFGPAGLGAVAALSALGLPAAQAQLVPASESLGLFGGPSRSSSPLGGGMGIGTGDSAGSAAASRFWLPQLDPTLPFAPGAQGVAPPTWAFQPYVNVLGGVTDNVNFTPTNRISDIYAVVSPGITVLGNSPRLVGTLNYQPNFRVYARTTDNNDITQTLSGQALATVIPEFFFIEASAFSTPEALTGSFGRIGQLGDNSNPANQTVQGTTYRISPYIVRRFGDFASGRLGYAFSQSFSNGANAFIPNQATPFFTSQQVTSNTIYGGLVSGDYFGLLTWDAGISLTNYSGDGAYDGAHNYTYVVQARYQLTREWALVGEAGWQDQEYKGVQPYGIDKPIWGVGARWTPDPDTYLSVRYGQRDGFESWTVDGAMLAGVRTRLVASYRESVGAPILAPNQFGVALRTNAAGQVVDAATGLPAALAVGRPLVVRQNAVTRDKNGLLAASQVWNRDTFTLAFSTFDQTPVSVPAGTSSFEQTTYTVTAAWTRDLEPGLSFNLIGRAGQSESPQIGDTTSYSVQTGLFKAFSPTLIGSLQYQFINSIPEQGARTVQNVAFFTLRQLF